MTTAKHKTVLFLCTGNFYRSRFAEILFNSVASRMRLPWRASSRGLALERGVNNIGPMALTATAALETMGIRAADQTTRLPIQATAEDFAAVELIIAMKQAEHWPLVQERFPGWLERVEFWNVDDAPDALPLIEREVMSLVARILGGGTRQEAAARESRPPKAEPPKKPVTIKVGRETKGRRGKGVTVVSEIPLDEAGLLELAAKLKQKCGTGGTVKDGRIEIQGDQRNRLVAVLEDLGFRVKLAGG
jgi:translation initiation factor 1